MKLLILLAVLAAPVFAALDPAQLATARALYDDRSKPAAAQQAYEALADADALARIDPLQGHFAFATRLSRNSRPPPIP